MTEEKLTVQILADVFDGIEHFFGAVGRKNGQTIGFTIG